MKKNVVAVIMGSDSDWPTMKSATQVLDNFAIPHEVKVVSAHRTPQFMQKYSAKCHKRGIKIIIAAAGGAAHLPGMVASLTPLPVIGVPIMTKLEKGLDSLLSIVQMPKGVPVATMGVDNSYNAALMAVRILAVSKPKLSQKLEDYIKTQAKKSQAKKIKTLKTLKL